MFSYLLAFHTRLYNDSTKYHKHQTFLFPFNSTWAELLRFLFCERTKQMHRKYEEIPQMPHTMFTLCRLWDDTSALCSWEGTAVSISSFFPPTHPLTDLYHSVPHTVSKILVNSPKKIWLICFISSFHIQSRNLSIFLLPHFRLTKTILQDHRSNNFTLNIILL